MHQTANCPNREHDITNVLDETFSLTQERFGEVFEVDLKPGGSQIPVTEANKKEYVDLVVEHRIHKRVESQFDAFRNGILELVPLELLCVFDERELELLIGGMSEIDMYVASILTLPDLTRRVLVGTTGQSSLIIEVTRRPTR